MSRVPVLASVAVAVAVGAFAIAMLTRRAFIAGDGIPSGERSTVQAVRPGQRSFGARAVGESGSRRSEGEVPSETSTESSASGGPARGAGARALAVRGGSGRKQTLAGAPLREGGEVSLPPSRIGSELPPRTEFDLPEPEPGGAIGGKSAAQPPEVRSAGEPHPREPEPDPDLIFSVPLNGSVAAEDATEPLDAQGLEIDEDRVVFGKSSRLTFPADGHVNGEEGSIAFDITPDWAGSDPTNNSLVQIRQNGVWQNQLQLIKNFNSLRFIFIDDTGVERNVNTYIDDWPAGERHRVTATWGEAMISLYVDGRLIGQDTYEGTFRVAPGTPIHIGSDFAGSDHSGAGGTISNFKIYRRALASDEVGAR